MECMGSGPWGYRRIHVHASLVLLCYKLDTLFRIFLAFSTVRR